MKAEFRKIIINVHYRLYSILNAILPKRSNYIFIYDAQFMRQNCWALYKYLIENGYDDKYRMIYYTEKAVKGYNERLSKGVVSSILKGWVLHLISRYTFYEYHNFKFNCEPGKKQITVYLTHGMPFKNYGYLVETPDHPFEDDYTYLLMTSEYYIPIMHRILGSRDDQVYIGGMPRCDQLRKPCDLNWIKKYSSKYVLWMPTFRKSKENAIDDSKKDFPLIDRENILELDRKLGDGNVCLIIKPHPFQDRISWLYDNKYENIKVIFNEDLLTQGIELYELLGSIDMLITDYSSVYSDFLLTGKPIAFAADDIDDYSKNRGFVDENLLKMIPGPLIQTYSDLLLCLTSIDKIQKNYKNEREKAQKLLSPQSKSNSFSKDLCDFLGITK